MVWQRTTRRGAGIALVVLVWVSAACTPMLTPPPLPPPATNDVNPDLAPRAGEAAYANPGPYAAGVTTITIESGRKADIWYPAPKASAAGQQPDTYHLKDFIAPFLRQLVPAGVDPTFTTTAYRGLPVADGGPFPLVLFSHGFLGYRDQSTFLTAHLATWGFVVVAPDYFERGLQGLLGDPPAPQHDDWKVADLTVQAMQAQNASGPLAGKIDTSRLFPVGHSAGGIESTDLAGRRTDVQSWISLAGGIDPTREAVPRALRDTTKSVLWMGGDLDMTAKPPTIHSAYDYTAGPAKLVMVPGSGHLTAFSDICETGRDVGGVVGIAKRIGLPVPDFVYQLGTDGCVPPAVLSQVVWPITRHFVTAELRYRAGIDPQPVGLGTQVVSQFGSITPAYTHKP